MKKLLISACSILGLALLSTTPAFAAAADGVGPWADSVISSSQGPTETGGSVPLARSNPQAAVGVAENNTIDTNFFSLGFGGQIVLGFDNGISNGVFVVEATNPNYTNEIANVELSADGSTWYQAGSVAMDGAVSVPSQLSCAKYVRITDISNLADFDPFYDDGDGYDVDGVMAQGDSCVVPTPTPTPSPTPTPQASCVVTQSNTTTISNNLSVISNTGDNNANQNTGGTIDLTTGDVTTSLGVFNQAGSNVANQTCICCGLGDVTVVIKDNGSNSTNTVTITDGGTTTSTEPVVSALAVATEPVSEPKTEEVKEEPVIEEKEEIRTSRTRISEIRERSNSRRSR